MAVLVKEGFPEYVRDESGPTIVVIYHVQDPSTSLTIDGALGASGVPAFNSAYGTTKMRALNIKAEPVNEGKIWRVTVTYRRPKNPNVIPPENADEAEDEIAGLLPIISAYPANETVTADRAWGTEDTEETGPTKAIVNSVGDLFDQPPVTLAAATLYNMRWFASSWNTNNEIAYLNTVNVDPVTVCGRSFPEKTALLQSLVGGKILDENGELVWEIEAQILFKPTGHAVRILDNGFRALDAGGKAHYVQLSAAGSYVPTDVPGDAVSDPVLLDGTGKLLVFTPPLNPATKTPVYLTFEISRAADWSPIGFPHRQGVKG